ncbi:hypothetical protein C1752_07875 [Acaryochloris thomasi RCC1774]|uniref:Uncharacterized protein n=1 Tax=Acaryochloris thomasi RCC1774 TaxID=1764569 RepID=A0A2W1JQF1_9CYAN|nr:hypothetical protein [Acaryochloris thomasi]PZD71147.1 hypothetical protein C1752_07875 [Acaryochloris thomasi RCC1774]
MNHCPICSNDLLRHIGHGHIYWFCPHCWQETPNLESFEPRQGKMQRSQTGDRPLRLLESHLSRKAEALIALSSR